MGKKKRSPYIGQAASISQQERSAGQQNIDKGVGDVQSGVDLDRQAVTNPTQSPLYKALYSTEAGQMSQAYDNASANTTQRARAAGFGYQQPVAQGAQDELRSRQASAIGRLPGEVMRESVPMTLQAGRDIMGGGRDIAQAGTSELSSGNEMFERGVVPLEEQYQNYSLGYTPMWQRALKGAYSTLPGQSGGIAGALLGV